MDMIGQPDNHCSFSLFCGYSDKKKTPYLWVLSCLYLILFKNRPIVPDATLDQVDPLVSEIIINLHSAQRIRALSACKAQDRCVCLRNISPISLPLVTESWHYNTFVTKIASICQFLLE